MILSWAVIVGFFAGLARAIVAKRRFTPPDLQHLWLVIAAFIPQFFAFGLPATRSAIPDRWIPYLLTGSLTLLLVFAALNFRAPGFWALGLGLIFNFLVIALNHGLMPISPETISRLRPDGAPIVWNIGERLGTGKDLVLPQGATKLWFLSDIFVFPVGQDRSAFSLGDVLIAVGAVILLWSCSGSQIRKPKEV